MTKRSGSWLASWYSGPERQCKIRPQNTIPYIGTEILFFHWFCIMEVFLFSKSIIAVPNSVNISRRIFLDRSQGLKCTKKLKISLVPEAYISLKLEKTQKYNFFHLTNSKFRAGLSGVSSATPSFWKPQFIFQKRDLLQKTENLHATLDSQAVKNSNFP